MTENEKLPSSNGDEPLFESTFKISDFDDFTKVQNIYNKAVGKKRTIKIAIITEIILAVITLLCFATKNFDTMLFMVILMVVFLIALPLEQMLIRKSYLKKVFDKEKSVVINETRVRFYDNKIVTESERATSTFDYSQITNAVFTKDVDLFLIGRMMICSGNDNFTKGNSGDLEKFIEPKISKAEIKKYN